MFDILWLYKYIYYDSVTLWHDLHQIKQTQLCGLRYFLVPWPLFSPTLLHTTPLPLLSPSSSWEPRLEKYHYFWLKNNCYNCNLYENQNQSVFFSRRIKWKISRREKLYHETMNPSKHQTSDSEYSNNSSLD